MWVAAAVDEGVVVKSDTYRDAKEYLEKTYGVDMSNKIHRIQPKFYKYGKFFLYGNMEQFFADGWKLEGEYGS